jgi:hypothetical protein
LVQPQVFTRWFINAKWPALLLVNPKQAMQMAMNPDKNQLR